MLENKVVKMNLVVGKETGWIGYLPETIPQVQKELRSDVVITLRGSFQKDAQGNIIQDPEVLREQATWKYSHIAIDTQLPQNEWMFGLTKDELEHGVEGHEPLAPSLFVDVMTGEYSDSEF